MLPAASADLEMQPRTIVVEIVDVVVRTLNGIIDHTAYIRITLIEYVFV
jgi:hypothetical protein